MASNDPNIPRSKTGYDNVTTFTDKLKGYNKKGPICPFCKDPIDIGNDHNVDFETHDGTLADWMTLFHVPCKDKAAK